MDPLSARLRRHALSSCKLLLARLGHAHRFSHYGEEEVIARWLSRLSPPHRVCVDIGASDGVEGSNTLALFRAGWTGLAVEVDGDRFKLLSRVLRDAEGVGLARCMVTPLSVAPLLAAHGVPREFGFLSLDIDGYDHFVLDALLARYRPTLMCVEINESFPPPLRFTVKWDPAWEYRGGHCYGQSLSALAQLGERHDFALVELHYNNAFLVPAERAGDAALTAEEAYARGYAQRRDRLQRMPWNADMEPLQHLSPEAARDFVEERFAAHHSQYELTW